ncbi:MAG TPA: hypothetical protein PKI60_07270 [Oscillospiraceae bacterium]|nr:hypothetical protein [Oscillospiraceae bacterium]
MSKINNEEIEQMAMSFYENIGNTFKDSDEIVNATLPIELNKTNPTDMFTALLLACNLLYKNLTQDKGDILDFISVQNKLAVRYISSDKTDGEEE